MMRYGMRWRRHMRADMQHKDAGIAALACVFCLRLKYRCFPVLLIQR